MSNILILFYNLVIYTLMCIFITLIHELGHGLVALILGGRFKIYLGNSAKHPNNRKIIFDSKHFAIIEPFFKGGRCTYFFETGFILLSKKKKIFLAFGGMGLQIIISLMVMIIFQSFNTNIIFLNDLYKLFQIMNIIILLMSLIPIKFSINKEKYISDMFNIINILKA